MPQPGKTITSREVRELLLTRLETLERRRSDIQTRNIKTPSNREEIEQYEFNRGVLAVLHQEIDALQDLLRIWHGG